LINKLGAGIITLSDLINLSYANPREVEVRNFFILMEVFGAHCPTDKPSFFTNRAEPGSNSDDSEDGVKKKKIDILS